MNIEGEDGAELFSTLCDKSVVVLVPAGLAWSDMAWGVSGMCCHQLFSTQSPFLQCLLLSLSLTQVAEMPFPAALTHGTVALLEDHESLQACSHLIISLLGLVPLCPCLSHVVPAVKEAVVAECY